jgi:4-hydroxybenzoate polyprenyltransferase
MSTIERPPIRTEPPDPLRTNTAIALLRELRPKQWTKNLLVLAGLVFSYNLRESGAIWKTFAAFLIFCAVSSASYVINDLADLEQDRRHPRKRLRPIASGAISEGAGWVIAAVLLLVSLPVAWVLSRTFFGVVVVYFAIVQMYSYRLKHVVLLDVFAIAAGFVLRAVAGAVVIPVRLSPWLLLCTMLAALFLALAKRRHELVLLEEGAASHRRILDEYSTLFLDQMIVTVTSATVIAYSIYTFSAGTLPDDQSMMLTIPFVLYGLFRYLYLIYQRNEGGSPETLLLRDVPLLITVLLWGLSVVLVLYRPWFLLS